jgi:CubicO group peptidase (beta-lactamase class C family)
LRRGFTLVLALVFAAAAHAASSPSDLEQAGDRAACCAPESEGLDSRSLIELTDWVRARGLPIFSLLVSRNGRLVYELYTSGLARDDAHYQMSVTKSFVSALVGIAIDKGIIAGTDVPLTQVLPRRLFRSDADVARFNDVTLRDVLGMSALDTPDPPRVRTPEAVARQRQFLAARERVAFALAQPVLAQHGHAFLYNDMTPVLATGALQYTAGVTAFDFAERHLFGPLAFRNEEWMHQDRSGVDNGGYGLRVRPIDMQKFGILYLRGGAWNGRQLISQAWVKQSFSPWNRSIPTLNAPDYGWFWWKYYGGNDWVGHMANGWKGQRIVVFPRQKVVVTMTACIQDGSELRVVDEVMRFVARSLLPDSAVAARAAQPRLNALLETTRTGYSPACPGGETRMVPSIAPKERRVPFNPDPSDVLR